MNKVSVNPLIATALFIKTKDSDLMIESFKQISSFEGKYNIKLPDSRKTALSEFNNFNKNNIVVNDLRSKFNNLKQKLVGAGNDIEEAKQKLVSIEKDLKIKNSKYTAASKGYTMYQENKKKIKDAIASAQTRYNALKSEEDRRRREAEERRRAAQAVQLFGNLAGSFAGVGGELSQAASAIQTVTNVAVPAIQGDVGGMLGSLANMPGIDGIPATQIAEIGNTLQQFGTHLNQLDNQVANTQHSSQAYSLKTQLESQLSTYEINCAGFVGQYQTLKDEIASLKEQKTSANQIITSNDQIFSEGKPELEKIKNQYKEIKNKTEKQFSEKCAELPGKIVNEAVSQEIYTVSDISWDRSGYILNAFYAHIDDLFIPVKNSAETDESGKSLKPKFLTTFEKV